MNDLRANHLWALERSVDGMKNRPSSREKYLREIIGQLQEKCVTKGIRQKLYAYAKSKGIDLRTEIKKLLGV